MLNLTTAQVQAEAVYAYNSAFIANTSSTADFREFGRLLSARQVYEAAEGITSHCDPIVFGPKHSGWSTSQLLSLLDLLTF